MKRIEKVVKLNDIAYHFEQADKIVHELYFEAESMSKGEERLNEIIMSLRAAKMSVTNLLYSVKNERS